MDVVAIHELKVDISYSLIYLNPYGHDALYKLIL